MIMMKMTMENSILERMIRMQKGAAIAVIQTAMGRVLQRAIMVK